ncbi:hypothetical protein GCM10007924_10100 [Sneathiella chinensis]|uniref:Uncharacterized protein n=1 Tax=Sneathiella chinensis TaxID=349750 RepID=A0ABQ5U1Q7_9PROT|nr:hypothetical protein GCM10007924_10100 [Sneathiella chinensis]
MAKVMIDKQQVVLPLIEVLCYLRIQSARRPFDRQVHGLHDFGNLVAVFKDQGFQAAKLQVCRAVANRVGFLGPSSSKRKFQRF